MGAGSPSPAASERFVAVTDRPDLPAGKHERGSQGGCAPKNQAARASSNQGTGSTRCRQVGLDSFCT